MAETISVVAMAIATFAVAINQILFTRHIKAVYVEVLQLQQQLRRLEKQLEYSVDVWDTWSKNDRRYHSGECEKKWNTFHGSNSPVTAGTIVQLAMEHGWKPSYTAYELGWDDEISAECLVVDRSWVEGKEIHEPRNWDPVNEITRYLETLFDPGENVGYVTGSWEKTDDKGTRWLPQKGCWDRTAGQLIEALNHCNGDIGAVLGDYNQEAGAWIRFNPLDGNGCKNENVTEFRYALVESDAMDLEQQHAIIRELELPVACLVFSGKKSLHAIVHVEAADYNEYRKRVEYLYNICKKNGLIVDTQNKNPSRLSRLPGVMRAGKKQYIIDTDIGKSSWQEWYEWIESMNDDLPDTESLESVYDKAKGVDLSKGSTGYIDLDIDKDKAVNELIDGYDAESVPDNLVADRLDSAGYALALDMDVKSINMLETTAGIKVAENKTAVSDETAYKEVLAAKTYLTRIGVPADGRWMICSPEFMATLMLDDHYIRQGDLSQRMKDAGATGAIAGFALFESGNTMVDDANIVSSQKTTTEFIAGHPNWCHRVQDWSVPIHLQDLNGSGNYIGASAVQGRKVYGMTFR